ncbi:MAG: phospholipase D-like domain-containing protein, partial [Pseudanabaena sp.]
MQVQFIAHSLNFDKVNPFDQAIEQIVNEEGSPVMVTPYFSLSVIQNICSEIHCVLQLVTDLEEIRNNIRSENEFELFAQLIKNNQLTLFDIPSLHAKIFVRGTKALIGSANFTNSGLGQNHEASISIHDAQFTLEVFRWVESLTNGRDSINLEQLRSAYQSALILKRVETNENQAVSKTYLAKSIKVSKSKYGNKKEPKKNPKSALKINTEVVQIVQTVFPRKADLLKALEL